MSKIGNTLPHSLVRGNSKIPATRSGFKDAQFGQDVSAMLKAGYNAAMACKKSGVIVIDIDYHDEKSTAMDDLKALEVELGVKLPRTIFFSHRTHTITLKMLNWNIASDLCVAFVSIKKSFSQT